jgi:hypothetical protein
VFLIKVGFDNDLLLRADEFEKLDHDNNKFNSCNNIVTKPKEPLHPIGPLVCLQNGISRCNSHIMMAYILGPSFFMCLHVQSPTMRVPPNQMKLVLHVFSFEMGVSFFLLSGFSFGARQTNKVHFVPYVPKPLSCQPLLVNHLASWSKE